MAVSNNVVQFQSLCVSCYVDNIRRLALRVDGVDVYQVPQIVVWPEQLRGVSAQLRRRSGRGYIVIRQQSSR